MTDSATEQKNEEHWYQQAAGGKFVYLRRHAIWLGLSWIVGGAIGAFLRDNAFLVQALPQILVGAVGFSIGSIYFQNRAWENKVAKYGLRRNARPHE